MLTFIWLALTTGVGYAIGYFFFVDYIFWTALIGFVIGLLIRFSSGSAGESNGGFVGDWGGSDSDGGSD